MQLRVKLELALIGILLVFCSFVFVPTSGWARLFWNVLGYLCLFIIYKIAKLSLKDIGLARINILTGLKFGGFVMSAILFSILILFFINKQFFHDSRYHHSLATAIYSSIIILPFKTIFFEELAFRGILPAILLKIKDNRWLATLFSSIAFGLWHVSSALTIGNFAFGSITIARVFVIFAVVAFTTLAGILLCELRWRSQSLVAPVAVHWFINGLAIILSSLSWS